MKILFLGNNWVAWKILDWLKSQKLEVVGLVVHPETKQKYSKEIRSVLSLPESQVFLGSDLNKNETLARIRSLGADLAISVLFDYILKKDFLEIFPRGVVNIHPSLLPYNRGQYPNVWSIVEKTPSGVTLHYIDEGIDTGAILAQKKVPLQQIDTGETAYRKLERACVELFQDSWANFAAGKLKPNAQEKAAGTYHTSRDVKKIDEINLAKSYTGEELINLLRARTFPPHKGAYFLDERNRKVYLRLCMEYDDAEQEKEKE